MEHVLNAHAIGTPQRHVEIGDFAAAGRTEAEHAVSMYPGSLKPQNATHKQVDCPLTGGLLWDPCWSPKINLRIKYGYPATNNGEALPQGMFQDIGAFISSYSFTLGTSGQCGERSHLVLGIAPRCFSCPFGVCNTKVNGDPPSGLLNVKPFSLMPGTSG